MGILGLSKLIADIAPGAIKVNEIKNYFGKYTEHRPAARLNEDEFVFRFPFPTNQTGRKVAIDASMCLYQFLIAVRAEGAQLTSVDGETTSHLMGTFYRTIRLLENGIKPVYVFDGKPPDMKSGELVKRAERRDEAEKQLAAATEAGDSADMDKFNRRLVRVTKHHGAEAQQLLRLMGVPFVEAPCEAEAQCAALVKAGKVYATATEDMDALTFGTTTLLRHLTFSEARKMPVQEFHFAKVLEGLQFTHEQFIDLCILLGCDYCESIRGIGPKRAIELVRQYETIEEIVRNIDPKKYTVPENWAFARARELFRQPDVTDPAQVELKWTDPDEEGLVKFLCGDRQFSEDRVRNGAKKIMKTRTTSTQGRLDGFFKVMPGTPKAATTPGKRKAEDVKKGGPSAKKVAKGGGRKPK